MRVYDDITLILQQLYIEDKTIPKAKKSNAVPEDTFLECMLILDEIKKKIEESNEVYMQETATRLSELKLKEQQFLEYAKTAEDKKDYIEALVFYQQALNTYCQVGDAENAIRLSLKIEEIFRKIPNLENVINDFKAEASNLRVNGDEEGALTKQKYAETLEDALFIPRD